MKSRILNKLKYFFDGYVHAFEDFFTCADSFAPKLWAVGIFLFFIPLMAILMVGGLLYLLVSHTLAVLVFTFVMATIVVITHILDNHYKNPKNK